MTASPIVAGVDGCPGGWVVVTRPLGDAAAAVVSVVATFAEVLAMEPAPAMIAVDIPIGLPDRVGPGGRVCDVAARTVLGQRQSSVFSVPSRAAVMETDYRAACSRALATSDPPRMVSKQAFNIFAKIREVDGLLTPALQQRVFEVHPEVAFVALNGWRPLDLPKKVKSRPHEPGLALRRSLLLAAGYRAKLFEAAVPRAVAGPDDILDAAAASWSAVRLLQGTARRFPENADLDSRGLRCEICA